MARSEPDSLGTSTNVAVISTGSARKSNSGIAAHYRRATVGAVKPVGRLLACAVALGFVLAGCGEQSAEEEPVDLQSLQLKVRALAVDTCHTRPRDQAPRKCEKYITQIANAARTVSTAGRINHEGLRDPGREMTRAVRDYNQGGCDNQRPKSVSACYRALETIAQAVKDVEAELEEIVQ